MQQYMYINRNEPSHSNCLKLYKLYMFIIFRNEQRWRYNLYEFIHSISYTNNVAPDKMTEHDSGSINNVPRVSEYRIACFAFRTIYF